jgi:1-acyl-sn-glycerol-3-phosphate acyltransferase
VLGFPPARRKFALGFHEAYSRKGGIMTVTSGYWRLLYRVPWLLLHVVISLPLTMLSLSFPLRYLRIRQRPAGEYAQCWWSATTCRIFGLTCRVTGSVAPGAALVAANHISWLDIQVLHGVSPMGFVAKAEIGNWPLAGWIAGFGETIYHHRGSHDSASSVVEVMVQRLKAGRKVAIFAEGGILPGDGVKRFHARLFAAAIESEAPVQPVMLRYLRAGKLYPEITFLPHENFMQNFFRLLRQPSCIAEVCFAAPIEVQGKQRRELAGEAQAVVAMAFARGLDGSARP